MNQQEVKPCPFCGKSPIVGAAWNQFDKLPTAMCQTQDCPMYGSVTLLSSWNSRPASSGLTEEDWKAVWKEYEDWRETCPSMEPQSISNAERAVIELAIMRHPRTSEGMSAKKTITAWIDARLYIYRAMPHCPDSFENERRELEWMKKQIEELP